jgi:hypothetical protein
MDVELTPEESAAVRQALRSYLSDLRTEIHDTDNRAFKQDLRTERDALEAAVAKLDAAVAGGSRDDAGHAVVRVVAVWVE